MNKSQKTARLLEKEADQEWAIEVKKRDNWECVICGRNERPQAHHIIPRENRIFRHDMFNGITLCLLHHKFSFEISPHKNAFMFFKWLMKYRPNVFKYLLENSTNDF